MARICKHCQDWGAELIQCVWCGVWVCRHAVSMVPWPDQKNAKPVCDRCCDESA